MFTRKGYATSVSGKTANGCPVRSAKPPDNMNFHYISPSADGETLRGFNTQKGKAYRLPFLFCYCRIKQRKFLQDAQPVLVEGLPGCLKIGRKRFAVNLLPIRQRPVALAFPVGMLARNLVEGYKTRKVDLVDWNDRENAEVWRRAWANLANEFLAQNNRPERIDHRSYERQGIDQIPTVHVGVSATQIQKSVSHMRIARMARHMDVGGKDIDDCRHQRRQADASCCSVFHIATSLVSRPSSHRYSSKQMPSVSGTPSCCV